MSDLSKQFQEMMKDNGQRIGPEIGAELKRLAVQGQMELASGLFNGNSFVPYGPGQYTPSNDHSGKEVQPSPAVHEPQHEEAQQQQHQGRSI